MKINSCFITSLMIPLTAEALDDAFVSDCCKREHCLYNNCMKGDKAKEDWENWGLRMSYYYIISCFYNQSICQSIMLMLCFRLIEKTPLRSNPVKSKARLPLHTCFVLSVSLFPSPSYQIGTLYKISSKQCTQSEGLLIAGYYHLN